MKERSEKEKNKSHISSIIDMSEFRVYCVVEIESSVKKTRERQMRLPLIYIIIVAYALGMV